MKIELVQEIEGSILDIGGGGEGIMGRLCGSQVTAIDNCQEELDEAPDGYEKMLMDGTALTFEDNRFCNVTFFYTLMYMGKEEQGQALREAVRVLKPGGSLYIWDAEILSAYPEPFCAELDIFLPGEQIHTTYGVVKMDTQDRESIEEMCMAAGLCSVDMREQTGHFYLHFRKKE